MATTLWQRLVGPRVPPDELAARRWRYRLPTLLLFAAAVALITTPFLPMWRMRLHAPQYPGGLEVVAHLTHLEGDVAEVDGLNHYIGMRPLGEAAVLERAVGVYAVVGLALLVAAAIFIHSWWAAVLTLPALLFPAVFLADLKFWLYAWGTNLDPTAPLTIEPFVPPVLGEGVVGQFRTVASPGLGLYMATLASLLIAIGLYHHRRAYEPLHEDMTGEAPRAPAPTPEAAGAR
ncbi:MAG: cytochrome C [Planctomycetes bacterium]|nr:cytochrome C [Planctomycetota bacterium]